MTIRTLLLASSLAAVGCSSSLVSGSGAAASGAAGTSGAAGSGSGGTGAVAGQGGGGGLAACPYSSFSPGAGIVGENGTSPWQSFTIAVSVVSSDDCTAGDCRGARRIVLAEAAGPRWTLDAYYSGLPADVVQVGEALTLQFIFRSTPTGVGTFDTSSTILARGSTAVIFDVDAASVLAPYGITVEASAAGLCMSDGCYAASGADVTYGTETRSVAPGQTAKIGKLSLVHRGFFSGVGFCGDSVLHEESMTGFTAR